jgi:hypothetical protein
LTARVNPTIYEGSTQLCRVGAEFAPALGAWRDAVIDPILEFLHLTPIGLWTRFEVGVNAVGGWFVVEP